MNGKTTLSPEPWQKITVQQVASHFLSGFRLRSVFFPFIQSVYVTNQIGADRLHQSTFLHFFRIEENRNCIYLLILLTDFKHTQKVLTMEILISCKMQLTCLVILLYLGFILIRDGRGQECSKLFDALLVLAEFEVLFDGITAYTVNHPETVPPAVNMICHLCFFLLLDIVLYGVFIYFFHKTVGIPKDRLHYTLPWIPIGLAWITVIATMNRVEFRQGTYTNYSMGFPVYVVFLVVLVLCLGSLILLLTQYREIDRNKRSAILICVVTANIIAILQVFQPEILCSSLAVTLMIISIFMNTENPSVKSIELYHDEMITGFATLVENKDDNTGGHIKRTTAYVQIIMQEMRDRGINRKKLNREYVQCIAKAAPMHDIGKIAIEDAILCKPGKLTDEEFEIMKTHTVRGGEIIMETFAHLRGNKNFAQEVYKMAMFHHEKWDGRGYPEGLSGEDIPLCARIMAVADVFDAVSAKRCYRDAMPLEQCFDIIRKGRGTDFDPQIADIFLETRPKIEEVYNSMR